MREFLKLMGEELLPSDVRDLKYLLQDSLSGKLYLILRFFGILKFSFLVGKSSRPEVFCKKVVLRNFVKLTEKHLCQSLLFNKVAGLRPATLLKKRLWHRCFPVNLEKFLRTPFVTEYLWMLLGCVNVGLLSLILDRIVMSNLNLDTFQKTERSS